VFIVADTKKIHWLLEVGVITLLSGLALESTITIGTDGLIPGSDIAVRAVHGIAHKEILASHGGGADECRHGSGVNPLVRAPVGSLGIEVTVTHEEDVATLLGIIVVGDIDLGWLQSTLGLLGSRTDGTQTPLGLGGSQLTHTSTRAYRGRSQAISRDDNHGITIDVEIATPCAAHDPEVGESGSGRVIGVCDGHRRAPEGGLINDSQTSTHEEMTTQTETGTNGEEGSDRHTEVDEETSCGREGMTRKEE